MASLTFTVSGSKYELEVERVTFGEARRLEKITGLPFGKLAEAMGDGSMEALQAFVWTAMRRVDHELAFDGLDDLAIADVEFSAEDESDDTAAGPTLVPAVSEATG